MTAAARRAADARGRRAETVAAWWLRLQGYGILARRVRTAAGEIDLVARRGRCLVFVEVKARGRTSDAGWALTPFRLRRVGRAAESLVARYGTGCTEIRLDAIIVRPWSWPERRRGVWRGGW